MTDEEKAALWWYFLSRQERREWTDQVKRMCFNQGLDAPETEDQISRLAYECDNA